MPDIRKTEFEYNGVIFVREQGPDFVRLEPKHFYERRIFMQRYDQEAQNKLLEISALIDHMPVTHVRALADEMQSWGESGGFAEAHGETMENEEANEMELELTSAILQFADLVWLLRPDARRPVYESDGSYLSNIDDYPEDTTYYEAGGNDRSSYMRHGVE